MLFMSKNHKKLDIQAFLCANVDFSVLQQRHMDLRQEQLCLST